MVICETFLPIRDYVTFGSLPLQIHLSSVNIRAPYSGVETFGNISEPSFDSCAKFYVNPAGRGVKCKRGSKIKRCFTCRRLCLVPMSRSSLSSPDKFPNKSIIIPCILHKTDSHSALLKQTRKFLVK